MSFPYPGGDARQSSTRTETKFPNVFDQEESGAVSVLQLYLVRHGETEANLNRIVAGQSEFPLTDLGIQQSKALGHALENISFNRFFVSDMERARHTAQLIAPSKDFVVEPRLREMGKGAREGLPKALTYEEAVKVRLGQASNGDMSIPLLESDQDVWHRVSAWLIEVTRDAIIERKTPSEDPSRACSVLVVVHAGIIRTICSQLVPSQLPKYVDVGDMGKDGSTIKHLVVPNTSVTVLDVSVQGRDLEGFLHASDKEGLLTSKLQILTWCEHLFHRVNKHF